MRAGVTDFGMTMFPIARCQARVTCAGVALWSRAIAASSGCTSRSPLPDASGDHAWVHDAEFCVNLSTRRLLQKRMKFDLVDCRDDSGCCDDSLQVMWLEVRDADRGHSSLVPEADQGTPAVDILVSGWTRPVDQIQIQRIDTKLVHGRVEGAKRFVETLIIILQLCCQIEVLPIVLSNCLPHGALVLVSGRAVNENVPLLVSAQHGRFSLVLSHLKDAQAQLGNRRAVVQRDCRNVTAHVILLICASTLVRLQVLSG